MYKSSFSYVTPPFILYMKTHICWLYCQKKKKKRVVDYLLLLELRSVWLRESEVGGTTWSPGTGGATSGLAGGPGPFPAG